MAYRKALENPDLSVADMKNFILALCHLILAEKVGDDTINYLSKQ